MFVLPLSDRLDVVGPLNKGVEYQFALEGLGSYERQRTNQRTKGRSVRRSSTLLGLRKTVCRIA
jgi:hypothetical protein